MSRDKFLSRFMLPAAPYDQTDLVWAVEAAAADCGLPSDSPDELCLLFDWLEDAGILPDDGLLPDA